MSNKKSNKHSKPNIFVQFQKRCLTLLCCYELHRIGSGQFNLKIFYQTHTNINNIYTNTKMNYQVDDLLNAL